MTGSELIGLASALAAIAAAIIAGRYAFTTQDAAHAGQRALELEKRLASSKQEVYTPMIKAIQNALDSVKSGRSMSERELQRTVSDFMTWAQIYASDEVVNAVNKWMKSAGSDHPEAGTISTYYIGRFLLALRRDLGDSNTEMTARDLLALRITDIYQPPFGDQIVLDEDEFLERIGWVPPWLPN